MTTLHWLLLIVALLAGGAAGFAWGALRGRAAAERTRLEAARDVAAAEASLAAAERALVEQRAFVEASRKSMEDAFGTLASRALAGSATQFLELAEGRFATAREQAARDLDARGQRIETLLAPIRDTLGRLERTTAEVERAREGAYHGLAEQVAGLRRASEVLEQKAGSLASALKGSGAQGRWGEIALRNVVELAGMSEHVDFAEQSVAADGKRPDLVVRLPGERHIAVDAKVSLNDYLEATRADSDEARQRALDRHAQSVRSHVRTLASRDYASSVPGEVDLVVLFLPGDPFLAAAFERDPEIQTQALKQRVLLATPSTLVALLRTVAIYWQQRSLAENAQRIAEVARELYDRAATFGDHLGKVGKGLDDAVIAFNKAVASFERRFLPMSQKLRDLHAADDTRRAVEAPARIEEGVRRVAAPDADPIARRSDEAPETLPLFSAPVSAADDDD